MYIIIKAIIHASFLKLNRSNAVLSDINSSLDLLIYPLAPPNVEVRAATAYRLVSAGIF